MKEVIAARLKLCMTGLGLSVLELARQADVKPSFIYDILNGKSANPSTIRLARVAEKLNVSLTYLVGQEEANDTGPTADNSLYVTLSTLSVENGAIITSETEGEPYYFHRTWISDRLSTKPNNIRLLFVEGDSMEPSLCHGDMVLLDLTKNSPSPPGIFVLFDGMGLTIKRLELISGSDTPMVRISSDNPQYDVAQQAIEDIQIVGRVVWFAREM